MYLLKVIYYSYFMMLVIHYVQEKHEVGDDGDTKNHDQNLYHREIVCLCWMCTMNRNVMIPVLNALYQWVNNTWYTWCSTSTWIWWWTRWQPKVIIKIFIIQNLCEWVECMYRAGIRQSLLQMSEFNELSMFVIGDVKQKHQFDGHHIMHQKLSCKFIS